MVCLLKDKHQPKSDIRGFIEMRFHPMNHHRDAGISLLDLIKKIGVDHKTIKRDIAKLKALGLLKRIGPAKGGHWEVLDK